MINVVAIMGRLTYDPELRTTPTGVSVVRFQVAVDRNFQRAGEERKADFIDVTAWRQTAEFVSKYFRKGSMIAVEGSIQTDNFTDKDGNKRKSVQVVASNVSFCGSKAESGTTGANSNPAFAQPAPSYASARRRKPSMAYNKGGARKGRKKVCVFCVEKVDEIDYKDVTRLKKFTSERAKILPRRVTGTCAKHQRELTTAIKRARQIAIMPYTAD